LFFVMALSPAGFTGLNLSAEQWGNYGANEARKYGFVPQPAEKIPAPKDTSAGL
jgi:hypothetical protein